MKDVCQQVGSQIRFYRKLRKYTLSDFANRINRSVSTLSKYENGSISIDILTLSEIAGALEVTIEQLLPPSHENAPTVDNGSRQMLNPCHFFEQQDIFYMYYCFSPNKTSPNKGIAVSAIEIRRKENEPDEVYLYNECSSPETNYRDCKYVYHGTILYYDFIMYLMLENIFHVGCHDYICAKVPFTSTSITTGLYTGVSESLRNPAATKVIISSTLLDITDDMVRELTLSDKDMTYDLKHRNALIVR